MKINTIGLRTYKTGLSIVVTLLISELISTVNPFFATIAAVFAMESSISATFTAARDRIYGTILGAIVAIIFSSLFPVNPISIGFGIIIVIYICNFFKWQGTIKISSIVFLAIILGFNQGDQFEYALYRTIDTFIGVSISTLINYFVFPFDVGKKIEGTLKEMCENLDEIVKAIEDNDSSVKIDLLEQNIANLKSQFELLQKEVKVSINPKHDVEHFAEVIQLFESIYFHLRVIDDTYRSMDGEKSQVFSDSQVNMTMVLSYHKERLTVLHQSLTKMTRLTKML